MYHDINQTPPPHFMYYMGQQRQFLLRATGQRFQPVPEMQQKRFFYICEVSAKASHH